MKGQSFIVEYILFFAISFSLFSTISFIFYNQGQHLSEQAGDSLSNLINNIVMQDTVLGVNCKACNNATFTEEIPSRIGGAFYKTQFQQSYLTTSLFASSPISENKSLFNLNETFSFSGTINSENKKVVILINNINKNIGVE